MSENLVALSKWSLNHPAYSPSVLDPDVRYSVDPSIRNDGVIKNGVYLIREVNTVWTRIHNGDLVLFKAIIKTNPPRIPPEKDYMGARIGIDLYSGSGRLAGINYNPRGSVPTYPEPLQGIIDNWVPMGSNWSYREIEFTVPDKVNGVEPVGCIMWFQVWTGYKDGVKIPELASAWMAEPEMYFNPIEVPQPEPQPKPPSATVAARVLPAQMLYPLWRMRETFIRENIHRKLHPLV